MCLPALYTGSQCTLCGTRQRSAGSLYESSYFQLVKWPQNSVLMHFQAEGAVGPKLSLKFVDFEVAHLSVLMVWRLPSVQEYPTIMAPLCMNIIG